MAIPPVLADELRRLRPEQIVVVGGPNSVSDVVLTQLDAFAPEVRRIGGANRYTVSQAVSADAFGSRMQSQQMLAATGNDFPDALSGGATAARLDAPIVLIDGHSSVIDDDTRWFLAYSSVDAVTAIGGPNSISPDMLDMLDHFTKWNSAGRYDGSDRFAVNRALNDDGGGSYPMPEWQQTAYLVNARNYPDALSATTLAGAEGARVYLAESTCVPRATLDLMRGSHIDHLVLVGGTASLSDAVARLTPC
jgi:putative cell wall-binding protein